MDLELEIMIAKKINIFNRKIDAKTATSTLFKSVLRVFLRIYNYIIHH